MKKKLLLFGGLLAIGLSFFASCSDKEDESLAPSSVDAKPWTLDENMNTQINLVTTLPCIVGANGMRRPL